MIIDAIPDAILELIFLRINSHFCLLDASSTCKRWRRVVAEAGFLRQFRSLHGPPVAGVYYQRSGSRNIEFEPSSAAISCRRFSLGFLQSINVPPPDWLIRGSRGTLLLLDRPPRLGPNPRDMVVCEPLTQRYKRIPPPLTVFAGYETLIGHLVDGEDGGCIGMSNFRVVCLLRGPAGHYDAGVFTASGSSWSIVSVGVKVESWLGSTKGFEYWHSGGRKVLSLNKSTAEFLCCVLPETKESGGELRSVVLLGVTTGRDGEDRIVVVGGAGANMTVFVRLHDGGSEERAAEKTIDLSLLPWPETKLPGLIDHNQIATTRAGAALIVVAKFNQRFCVDMETNEVERARQHVEWAHPWELPWPPTLRACTQLLNT